MASLSRDDLYAFQRFDLHEADSEQQTSPSVVYSLGVMDGIVHLKRLLSSTGEYLLYRQSYVLMLFCCDEANAIDPRAVKFYESGPSRSSLLMRPESRSRGQCVQLLVGCDDV
jgi:hypothetical protein